MGSTISIHNDTEVTLNIALSQVGPLYYQNCIAPGQCATFDVGKVWFTIEGRVWNGENEYNGNEIARSIINCTLEAIAVFMIIFNVQRNAITFGRTAELLGKAMSEVKIAHETDVTNQLLKRLFDGRAINSPGWYCGYDRHVSISGGPKYVSVGDEGKVEFHKIDVDTLNNPFTINEK